MTADQVLARKAVVKSSPNKQSYTVKSGDSLWKISQSQQVTVAQLMKWNNLTKQSTLSIGKNLVIYPNEMTASTRNSLQNSKLIQPGQILKLIMTNS